MARGIDRNGIKKIIDEIKKKPVTWTDLKALTKLPETTLNRYLSFLEYWGLAKKNDGGYWDWCERVPTFETERDYDLALDHSKKLLSTMEGFFGVFMINPDWFQKQDPRSKIRDELYLSEMVREHLRTGYPMLFDELVNFDKLVELRKQTEVELSAHGLKVEKDRLTEYVASYRSSKAYAIPKHYRKIVGKIVARIEPERLDFIEKTEKLYNESLVKVSNDLRRLVYKVEHGEPLMGICDLCPKSKVVR